MELLDNAAIADAKAIMKDKYQIMIGYFLEDAETYLNLIKTGLNSNDMRAITMPSHTLKSSSRQMGAARLSMLAREVEEICLTGQNIEKIANLVPRMEAVFAETTQAFKEM